MGKSRKPVSRTANRRKPETPSHPEVVSSSEKPFSLKSTVLVLLALVALNLIIYAPSLHFGFLHYDDSIYVSENVEVAQGFTWHGLLWAFNLGYAANWHPLTWLSHMLDVQLYGMVAERHHLTSILLHIANSLLLFWLLCRTTRAWRRSAVVALLFAVHPLHVESVAWIAERKDVLSTLFWMLTFHAYVSYTRRPLHRYRLAVLLIFSLGLMAKPMLVTLPLVLLLFDIWPLGRVSLNAGQGRIWLKLLLEKIPLLALSAISSILTVIAQWRGGAVQNFEMLPFSQRAANAVVAYVMYIVQMLWPRNLIAYYFYEPPSVPLVVVSVLILASISALTIYFAKRFPYFLSGWIWYLCALLPVIGLIQVGEQSRADRYTYVPLIGLFIIAAWGIPKLLKDRRLLNIAVGIAAGVLICVFAALARNQVAYWENDLILWDHAVQSAPRNCFARTNLGTAFATRGDLEAAIDQYAEALRIKPNSAETHNGLGMVLSKKGLWRESEIHYAEAIRIKPRFAEAHGNMGILLEAVLGKSEEAISEFEAALKIDPQKAEIRYDLGLSLAGQGKMDEAIAQYKKALEIKPSYAEAHTELGNALFLKGELSNAIGHYNKALEINPELANTHSNLGLALMTQKRFPEAIFHFNEALRINPNSIQAQRNLELAMKSQ
jgi:protein O-mannosyl-transferase